MSDKLRERFEEKFSEAVEDGQWMAAVWSVKDGALILKNVTTSKFPYEDMPKSIDMFSSRIGELIKGSKSAVEEPEPLPAASLLPWLDRKPILEEAQETPPQSPSTRVEDGIMVEVKEVGNVD